MAIVLDLGVRYPLIDKIVGGQTISGLEKDFDGLLWKGLGGALAATVGHRSLAIEGINSHTCMLVMADCCVPTVTA